jgi:hypothetical protein
MELAGLGTHLRLRTTVNGDQSRTSIQHRCWGDAHGPPPHLNPPVTFLPSHCRRWGLRYVFRSTFTTFGQLPNGTKFFQHPLADFGLAS